MLPMLPPARAAELAFPWREELDTRAQVLPVLPDGLRVPAHHAVEDLGDDRVAVWMEDVDAVDTPWTPADYERTADALGRLAARRTPACAPAPATCRPASACASWWSCGDRPRRRPGRRGAAAGRGELGAGRRPPPQRPGAGPRPDPDGAGRAGHPADGAAARRRLAGEPAPAPILPAHRAGLAASGVRAPLRTLLRGCVGSLVTRTLPSAFPLEQAQGELDPRQRAFLVRRAALARYLVDLVLAA